MRLPLRAQRRATGSFLWFGAVFPSSLRPRDAPPEGGSMWRKRARGLASHLRDLNGALRVALSRFKAQLSGCTAPGRPKAPNQARRRRLERFVRLGNVPLHRMTRWERRLSAHCRDDLLLRREILSLGAASEKRTEKTWPRIPRITRKRAALNSGLRIKGSRRNKFPFWRERRAGRCEAPRRRRCRTSSRSGNKADARPPPRPSGLRPAGPLALLLAPHIPPRL